MNNNRRKFIRNITLGAGALATGVEARSAEKQAIKQQNGTAAFNMCEII